MGKNLVEIIKMRMKSVLIYWKDRAASLEELRQMKYDVSGV